MILVVAVQYRIKFSNSMLQKECEYKKKKKKKIVMKLSITKEVWNTKDIRHHLLRYYSDKIKNYLKLSNILIQSSTCIKICVRSYISGTFTSTFF